MVGCLPQELREGAMGIEKDHCDNDGWRDRSGREMCAERG